MIDIKITLLKLFLIFLSPLIINSLATDFIALAIDIGYILEIEPSLLITN